MEACRRHGMGMMNIRVYAGGPLASPQRHGREYIMIPGADLASEDKRAAAIWAALGDRYGTPAQTALRFALTNTDFACSVVGIADLAQLDEALAAVAMGPLPPDATAQLEAAVEEQFRSRADWSKQAADYPRSQLRWRRTMRATFCRPT